MTVIFTDDFNRTVAVGLGTSPDTTEWSNVVNDDATVVPAAGGNPGYASNLADEYARYQGLPWIKDGTITFDFWVPHDRSDGDIGYRVDGQDVLVSPPNHRTFITIQIQANGDGSSYFIATGNGIAYSVNVARDTWYRCKYTIDVAGAGGTERVKVWKASLPEPGTWDASTAVITSTRPAITTSQIGFRFSGGVSGSSTTEARFTNLIVETDHVDTVIWDPSSPHFAPPVVPPHDIPYRVEILYDETDDITGICSVENSVFESMASGEVGTCEIWVKDLAHDQVFAVGKPLALKIDGHYEWRGFVTAVSRRYLFPADNTVSRVPALVPRWKIIHGSDLNILFSKRIVYNKAHLELEIPYYPAGTHDNTIIADMVANFLDLTGDGIDTSSGVVHVGTSQIDNVGAPMTAGQTWGEAMKLIAALPSALWYIDPDKVLRYVNVETVTAPWTVSDTPDGVSAYGAREIVVLNDGTALANDALVWGAGKGDADPHFQRFEDSPSEVTHGRWQWSDHRLVEFKDSSLLLRAQTYVNGQPGSHRGHKDDLVGAELVLFRAGLRVGMVLTIQVHTFQFNEDLPIRQMRISFPASKGVDAETGHFLSFVKYWVNATRVFDEPWASGERPLVVNVRPNPNCQYVPMIDACTGDAWTGSFYDPFDRAWSIAGPWGDGGCGPWGHQSNTGSTGTEWVTPGPGPWCVVLSSASLINVQDGSFIDDANRPEAMNSSFQVTANPTGTVSASSSAADRGGSGATANLNWPVSSAFYLRIQRNPGSLNVKMWRLTDPEPDRWTISIAEGWDTRTVPAFKTGGPLLYGSDLQITARTKPGAISVANGSGWGWAYYIDAFTSVPLDFVSTYPPYNWESRFFPAGTFPFNPTIVGSTQPIDAACTSNAAPNFARGDSGSHSAGSSDPHRLLYNLHWAWNSDNPDFSVNGTTQADGRMLSRNHFYAGFLAPRGATTVTVHARVFVSAPETGVFGLGSQPAPSGEGGIDWELWDVDAPVYDGTGSDTADPSHTLMGSGTLADYTYYTDTPTNYADITYSRAISEGDIFQIGGKILNTDGNLITTHGPADSFPSNSGGRRVIELKLASMDIRFDWDPTACGPAEPNVAGYNRLPVNCNTNTLFCEAPKWKSGNQYELLRDYVNSSVVVYHDGVRLSLNVDYTVDDATLGLVTISAIPSGDQTEHLSVCYGVRDLQIFELPKADPKYNKHPGYTSPTPPPAGYHPRFVPQLGWGTVFDSSNCTCASAAMWLDAVTGGSQRATPPEIRNRQSDFSGGISLSDAAVALATYGVTLHVHSDTFAAFSAALDTGPVMMAGLYGQIPPLYNSDLPFTGGHSMMALCWSDSKKAVLVYDPLNTASIWMPTQVVRDYMEAFGSGSCEYGATV